MRLDWTRLARSSWLRIAGTAAGVALLVHAVDLHGAAAVLAGADPRWALVALVLVLGTGITGTLEWGLMLRAAAPHVGWRPLTSWYLQGLFVGQVTPSGGGCAMQALAAGRHAGHGRAVAAIAAARMSATLAMAAWGLAAAAMLHDLVGRGVLVGSALYLACMVCVWPLAFATHRVTAACGARSSRLCRAIARQLATFTDSFAALRRQPRTIAATIAVSTAGWGVQILTLVVLGRCIGVEAPWTLYAVSVPIALLAGVAPISVGGIGLREGVLVGLLTHWGVDGGHAAALAVLLDLQRVPLALVGALAVLHTRRGTREAQPTAAVDGVAREAPATA